MPLDDTFKELYELELDRNSDLRSALALPAGVVSLILGGLVFMAKELHWPLSNIETLQLLFMTISGGACVGAGVKLLGTLTGFTYRYLPSAGSLNDYRDKLVAFHLASGGTPAEAEAAAESETMEYIAAQYVADADHNTGNNDAKSAALNHAHLWIIVALFFTVAAGVFFIANSIASPRTVQKFELVNPKEEVPNGRKAPASSNIPPAAPATSKTATASESRGSGGSERTASSAASAAPPPMKAASK
jgi:hypothetical protein